MQTTLLAVWMVAAGGWAGSPMIMDGAEGYWQPGGYENRIGSPYFYSVPSYGYGFAAPSVTHYHAGQKPCPCGAGAHGYHHRPTVVTNHMHYGTYGHAGYGYGAIRTDPYTYHFGPGYYRHAEHGHYRFPYYSYRRPWYHPGQPVFNRDTNFAW